jgi:hypothetical protein
MAGRNRTAPSRNDALFANSDSQEWRLATGGWQLASGSWQLASGGWQCSNKLLLLKFNFLSKQ